MEASWLLILYHPFLVHVEPKPALLLSLPETLSVKCLLENYSSLFGHKQIYKT
jgi:hypothetical protein